MSSLDFDHDDTHDHYTIHDHQNGMNNTEITVSDTKDDEDEYYIGQ